MAEREFRTTPQWPIATTPLSGDELVEVWKGGKQYYVPFSELGGMPAAHSGTHKHGGDDEVGTLDNLAYGIPKLDADGLIDSRVSDASTTTKGKVQLATDGEEDATKPPASTDSRLKDARPPTAHAAQHIAGTDVIDDATVSNSGLMSAADKVKADATIPAYIPTADQKDALAGTEGTASGTNKYVTDEDGRLPTAGEKAALAGSYGTPSAVNRFVTESDPVLSSIGGGGGTTGPDLLGIGQIGNGLSIASLGDPALAGLNSTDVAFIDRVNDELRCYTFNGTNWTQKGNGLSVGVSNPALAPLSSTDVAFIDSTNNELRTYTFDGTNWTQKGNGLSVGVSNPALASLNSTDVAFVDGNGNELRCYTFDGTNWTQKGNGLSIANTAYPALAGLNSTDVAFIDRVNDELRCYTFDGTNWTQKGSGLSIGDIGEHALASLNSTDVAFIDRFIGELRCYTFDGTSWTQKGSGLSIANTGELALASLTSTDVAFIDGSNRKLQTYKFLFGYDSASVNIAADYEVPEIATGKSIVIRRTSAYDGNPVTITPPSGATFEGLASLSLYGQYSFVELERISSTVFAIKNESFVGPVDCTSRVAEYTGDGIPLIPDNVAGRTYFQDAWATTDGWSGNTANISVVNEKLIIDATGTLTRINKTITINANTNKTFRLKIKRISGSDNAIQIRNVALTAIYGSATLGAVGVDKVVDVEMNTAWTGSITSFSIFFVNSAADSEYEIETIYIGTGAYDTPALDRAGNGNSLSLNAVTPVNGKFGKEMSFNGSTSYAQASSPVIGTTGTIAIRFKRSAIGTQQKLFDNRSANTNGVMLQFSATNILTLYASNGTDIVSVSIATATDTTTYHALVITLNGVIYFDSVAVASSPVTSSPVTYISGLTNLYIGRGFSGGEQYNGIISHFRYDSRIWTADEARAWSLNPISIDSRV